MKKNIYIFSGLGADERAFQHIDFSLFNPIYIKWIIPLENESIANYAQRLLAQINLKNPVLLGLSFGGLIAVEIAKQILTEKVILISSAKTKNEIPFYYRMAGQLRLHKIFPAKWIKKSNFITNWFFGTATPFDKQVLKVILADTDEIFLKWAIDKLVHWENQVPPENVLHIHGTTDKILPYRFVNCDIKIANGGHLMSLNKAEELTGILRRESKLLSY